MTFEVENPSCHVPVFSENIIRILPWLVNSLYSGYFPLLMIFEKARVQKILCSSNTIYSLARSPRLSDKLWPCSSIHGLWSIDRTGRDENCVKFEIVEKFSKKFPLSDWQANSVDFEPLNFKNFIFIFNRKTLWNCCEPIWWIFWSVHITAFWSFLKIKIDPRSLDRQWYFRAPDSEVIRPVGILTVQYWSGLQRPDMNHSLWSDSF